MLANEQVLPGIALRGVHRLGATPLRFEGSIGNRCARPAKHPQ